jgi:hypothetical protein
MWKAIAMLIEQVVLMVGYQPHAIAYLLGDLVSWRSKNQSLVSHSTAEAEYRAMSQGLSEILWVNFFIRVKCPKKRPHESLV